ncbi:MAG: shikimate kinase [Isosphaeraceae bacterium]
MTGLSLVGYRGTGKTTVGRLVAARLGLEFADADHELERRAGRSIATIFAEHGEPSFRDLEEAVLQDLSTRPGLVLATGGGAILRETNRAALKRLGPVVWLTAPVETLARRLQGDRASRPALTAAGTLAEIADVLNARTPLYQEVADLVIDTKGHSPRRVADLIIARIGDRQPGEGGRS